jgi:CHRD domain
MWLLLRIATPLAVIAGLALPTTSGPAAAATFSASLSGTNEVPSNGSPGTGSVTALLDTTAQTLELIVSFSGLTTPDVAAHIHCCAPLGTNVGVATTIPTFAGFPLGVTSGTFDSTFSLANSTFYNPAFVTLEGGLAQAEAALIAGIEDGQSYFNIHTTNFPGGEIRGQLEPTPLPAALPLFATGLGAMGLFGWRRKRKASTVLAAA